MSKIAEFRTPIARKRPTAGEWEFQDSILQYEVQATEYVIEERSAWLVKVDERTYWSDNGTISLAKFDGTCLERFADPLDVHLRDCICKALGKFEELAKGLD